MSDTIILRVTPPEAHSLQAAITAEMIVLRGEERQAWNSGSITVALRKEKAIELLENVSEEIGRALCSTPS